MLQYAPMKPNASPAYIPVPPWMPAAVSDEVPAPHRDITEVGKTCPGESLARDSFYRCRPEAASLPWMSSRPCSRDYFQLPFDQSDMTCISSEMLPTSSAWACPSSTLRPAGARSGQNERSRTDSSPGEIDERQLPVVKEQLHSMGQCTPCAFFWHKKDGCRKGNGCEFCHLCKKNERKRRKRDRALAELQHTAHQHTTHCGSTTRSVTFRV